MILRPHLESIALLLIEKNRAYGNSALDPVRIWSDASPGEAIRVRLDDKVSRLVRGHAAGEDTLFDLIGYLFLLRIFDTRFLGDNFAESVGIVVDEASDLRLAVPATHEPISARIVDVCKRRKHNPIAAIVELTALLVELRG